MKFQSLFRNFFDSVYDDVPGAFQVWTTEGKIKIHTLSSGPVDGQLDYFSNTSKGDLSTYVSNGISTTNPQINSTETGYVNFRELSKKILQTEPNNILLLTDKVKGEFVTKIYLTN